MTAPDPQSDAMLAYLAANPAWRNDPNATPRVVEDEDSLRRSHGLSQSARREQRRPRGERVTEPWMDELATAAELRAAGVAW